MSKHDTLWFLTHGRLLRLLGSFLIVLLPSAAYAMEPCSLATITGTYAFATLGQQAEGYGATLFLITSDGKGNLTGTGTESLNGTISSGVTETGTYSITTACWFTLTTVDSLGNIRNIVGAIDQKGAKIVGLSTDAGTELQFTAYRQNSARCLGSAVGWFVSAVQSPLTPQGSSTSTQNWAINKKEAGTASWVANINGTAVSGTATATYSVNSDCTFTSTVASSDGTTGHFFGIQGIDEVEDVAWLSIESDNGWVSLGTTRALCTIWPRC